MAKGWLPSAGFILAAVIVANLGCGGGSSVHTTPPGAISMSISHIAAKAIDANQSDALVATVLNDPKNRGVKWTVACPPYASTCGGMVNAVSASGAADTYRAPSGLSSGELVTIYAASITDPTQRDSVSVTVMPAPTLNPGAPFPISGNVGQFLSIALTYYFVDGTAPYTWRIKSGILPSGLSWDPHSGFVSGIPTTVSTAGVQKFMRKSSSGSTDANLAFTVIDSGNPPVSLDIPISLSIGPQLPFAMAPSSGALPQGKVGNLYRQVLHCFPGGVCIYRYADIDATGGVQPYTFAWTPVAGSALPPGLSFTMSNSNANFARIYGTPTTAGTYNFQVTVTDSESPAKQSSANYSITVVP